MQTRTLRAGADIGGTFTDIVLVSEDIGSGGRSVFEIGKVLTTPSRPDDAVLQGIALVVDAAAAATRDIGPVIHGTTLFTNALIERKGARTALIATRGFRDAIEIGREHRYDMYDLHMQRPRPLAPRHLRFEVDERVSVAGRILEPLDEASLEPVIEALVAEGVEAVGVCLLHAYANPAHEERIGAILARRLPDVAVTLSSDLVPEIREYERGSTVLANVYVQRLAERYLTRLRQRLADAGHAGELFVMQSNGGLCEIDTAARYPIRLVESGPAAGALAAAHYGGLLSMPDLLSFDMGGTTAKACLIVGGEPSITPEFEVDRQYQFKKGSGLPVKVPVIEMIEIGTGGGSIARIDALGRLRVGPESAGAQPGPACYGQGGGEPTVTDADLVLGHLDPAFFLGGAMTLDRQAAERVIMERIAAPRGLDLLEAAHAIHQLANESMASAARIHAVERGREIGRFPIFAFGGAGPVHAFGVARILRSPKVVYPLAAGVMSAMGFLAAPMAFDFVRTRPMALDTGSDWQEVMQLIEAMEEEGRAILGRTIDPATITFRRFADMRYRKQGYEIRVPLPDDRLDAGALDRVRAQFDETYRGRYGHNVPNTPVDIVSWRVVAQGPKPSLALPRRSGVAGTSLKGERMAWSAERRCMVAVPVHDRYALAEGTVLHGPVIVEERESTVVIGEGAVVGVDGACNLIVEMPAEAPSKGSL